jgi:hypothetical protein
VFVRYTSAVDGVVARSSGSPPLVRVLVERERVSLSAHREVARGSGYPPPKASPRGTFFHGFLLPFSLILATLRHPALGRSYLRVLVARALAVAVLASLALQTSERAGTKHHDGPVIRIVRKDRPKPEPRAEDEARPKSDPSVHVHAPGVHVDFDPAKGQKKVEVLGKDLPVIDDDDDRSDAEKAEQGSAAAKEAAPPAHPVVRLLSKGWKWVLWFLGIVSATEGFIVFFSRRWDDWLGFHVSALARILPEDAVPKTPKLAVDVRWLFKKLKERVRGYVVFGAGVPLIAAFQPIPVIGHVLFSVGLTVWGWYWLAVFTAAKSEHAWADDGVAPSPLLIREIRDRSEGRWWLAPVRLYGRLWGRLTRSLNSPALAFERNPAPYLGLALARAILSLPGLYLLARPVIPVAAGRLCAENDPEDRFSAVAQRGW